MIKSIKRYFKKLLNRVAFKFREQLSAVIYKLRLTEENIQYDRIRFYVEEMVEALEDAGWYIIVEKYPSNNRKPEVYIKPTIEAKKLEAQSNNITIATVDLIIDKFADKGKHYYPYILEDEKYKNYYFLDDEFFDPIEALTGVKNEFSVFAPQYVREYKGWELETKDSSSWIPDNPMIPEDNGE